MLDLESMKKILQEKNIAYSNKIKELIKDPERYKQYLKFTKELENYYNSIIV